MKKYLIIAFLSIIASINAAYLTSVAYSALSSSFCDISETFSCSKAFTQPETMFFGYPFPAIALIVYPIIFLLAMIFFSRKNKSGFKILALISGGGIIFNSYFIYQEYLIGTYCPLCLLCSAIIITIFALSLSEIFKKEKKLS
jgi:uncharacterized membrane protein